MTLLVNGADELLIYCDTLHSCGGDAEPTHHCELRHPFGQVDASFILKTGCGPVTVTLDGHAVPGGGHPDDCDDCLSLEEFECERVVACQWQTSTIGLGDALTCEPSAPGREYAALITVQTVTTQIDATFYEVKLRVDVSFEDRVIGEGGGIGLGTETYIGMLAPSVNKNECTCLDMTTPVECDYDVTSSAGMCDPTNATATVTFP
jgi:hypothetical protein